MPDQQQLVWLFFRLSGRVNRAAYFLSGLLLYLARAYPAYRLTVSPDQDTAIFWFNILIVVVVALFPAHICLSVKRLHDLGQNGWIAAFYVVGDVFFFLFLSLVPGMPGPNRYGARTNQPA